MSKARDLANAGTALGAVTATELGYVDGVTSAIQTQIDAKEATLPSQTGNSGKYLTTDGSAKSWGTVSAGGMTLISTTSLTGSSSITIGSIPQTYNNLQLVIKNYKGDADGGYVHLRINADTGTRYSSALFGQLGSGDAFDGTNMQIIRQTDNIVDKSLTICDFPNYTNTTTWKLMDVQGASAYHVTSTQISSVFATYIYNQSDAITSIVLTSVLAAFSSGTALLYGVK